MLDLSKSAMRYLQYLNLKQEPPTYQYLSQISRAQLHTFPFENISKLLYYRDHQSPPFELPSLELFTNNFNEYQFGGTCYTLNLNLMRFLKELGFDCYTTMLGNEHMGIIVTLNDERVYVDCGASAPFFYPIRLEREKREPAQFGKDEVHIVPVEQKNDQYHYIRYTDGKQTGKVWPFQSKIKTPVEKFTPIIERSYQPGAMFMSILRCQLYQADRGRSVSLVNNKFGIRLNTGETSVRELSSTNEIQTVLKEEFHLPKLPVAEAVEVLGSLSVDIFSQRTK